MSTLPKALVTGSSSGIGAAISRRLLDEGFAVLGLSRRPGDIEEPGFEHVAIDLSDLDELPSRLGDLVTLHDDVSTVVLNAGRGLFGSLEELSYEQMRELMELNFLSQAFVVRAFLPLLKKRRAGTLVFIGSEAAHRGGVRGSIYSATKFALRGFAQSLRQEASRSGVRVVFVSPAMTRTAFYDSLAFAPGEAEENALDPEDVADAVTMAVTARSAAVVDEIRLSPLKKVVRKSR